MTFDEAAIILSKIEFLHFKYELHPLPSYKQEYGMNCKLNMTVAAPDTRHRGNMIKVLHEKVFTLDENASVETFIEQVFEMTVQVLRHEASELFKFDGKDVYNEHRLQAGYPHNHYTKLALEIYSTEDKRLIRNKKGEWMFADVVKHTVAGLEFKSIKHD